jgi:glycosyltransferase involved in cell wall biosynthesis
MLEDNDLPPVSIILAVRNEEEHLDRCLESLVALDYPADKIEILLVDGLSSDRTIEIIDRWSSRDSRIRKLANPRRIVSTAMNIGLRESRYDLILWTSGHVFLQLTHLRQCLKTMTKTGAAAVGGVLRTEAFSPIGKINATILSSRFGVGNAAHRIGGQSGWVPAVTMALYKKDAIVAAGAWGEKVPRSQDNDLHDRMNKLGAKSYLDSEIRPIYLCRETLSGLLKQSWTNGYWNVMLTKMKRRGFHVRHFVPMIFVLFLFSLGLLSFFSGISLKLLLGILLLYLLLALGVSVYNGAKRRFGWQIPLMVFWFLGLHLSYGIASWVAVIKAKPVA